MITYKELVKKHYILQRKRINPFKAKEPFHPFEGFGIECGKGWYGLLDDLCTKIEAELDKDPALKKDFNIDQIKEKFGGLRFYSSSTDIIDKLITEAEDKSFKTCEDCGKPGLILTIRGWMCTVCKECAMKDLLKWKKDVIDGITRAKESIIILMSKKDLSDEEGKELDESQEWINISSKELKTIDCKLKKYRSYIGEE